MDKDFGTATTVIPLPQKDGRLHFAYRKPLRVRVLQWLVAALWLISPAIVLAALMS